MNFAVYMRQMDMHMAERDRLMACARACTTRLGRATRARQARRHNHLVLHYRRLASDALLGPGKLLTYSEAIGPLLSQGRK